MDAELKSAIIADYKNGSSLSDINRKHKVPLSTARWHILNAGILRSTADAVRLASEKGKLGSGRRGKSFVVSDETKKKISAARNRWAETNASGFSIKPNGYKEYTRGVHKGRSEHVVKMERRIGRRLLPDECVHHIDGNPLNNDENNLALLTISGHARLHRIQDKLSGNDRRRNKNGQFA